MTKHELKSILYCVTVSKVHKQVYVHFWLIFFLDWELSELNKNSVNMFIYLTIYISECIIVINYKETKMNRQT